MRNGDAPIPRDVAFVRSAAVAPRHAARLDSCTEHPSAVTLTLEPGAVSVILWCAYCQTFQGEEPPFDDYAMTHGLCAACDAKDVVADAAAMHALQPLVEFHRRLRARARASDEIRVKDLLDEARGLGVSPVDLLLGLVQPALYEIGDLWARGEVTVATEHRFSFTMERVASAVAEALPSSTPRPGELDYLLVNAEGNGHTLGLRFLDVFLRSRGRSTVLVVPGLPSGEVVALARALAPKTLGMSIAQPEQLAAVREVTRALADAPRGPAVVVGGYPVKTGLALDPALGARAVTDPFALLEAPAAVAFDAPLR